MDELESVRLDRWLFSVRIFKTRSLAAQAISAGKIKVDGHGVKSHHATKVGEKITLRRDGRTYEYEVLKVIDKRVGAPIAKTCFAITEDPDLTPEVREMVKLYREIDKGAERRGKPTKKERRQINQLKGEF